MPVPRPLFAITACVVLLHAVALWALYARLQRPAGETAMTVMRVTDVSPQPPVQAARLPEVRPVQATADTARAVPRAAALSSMGPSAAHAPTVAPSGGMPSAMAPAAAPAVAPATGALPAAFVSPSPSAVAATGASPGASPGAASVAGSGSSPGVSAARVEGPSSVAEHLRNPKPAYPSQSRRLGEQGEVVLRVLVGEDGVPQKAQVQRSSGHDRLDRAALATVLAWRYVPGKRGGVPEAMWMDVPIQFVLE